VASPPRNPAALDRVRAAGPQPGATYRNSQAGEHVWTASTIEPAMVVDLLTRQRAGTVALSPTGA
jgi:hypothetical protein